MALEKKQHLRKLELIFTDGKIHEDVHAEFSIDIKEDSQMLTSMKSREVISLQEAKRLVKEAEIYVHEIEQ